MVQTKIIGVAKPRPNAYSVCLHEMRTIPGRPGQQEKKKTQTSKVSLTRGHKYVWIK
jgi:hypothetical protein